MNTHRVQAIRQFLITEWLDNIFASDKLTHIILCGQRRIEEVIKRNRAPLGQEHVFVRGCAAHGGFMQANIVRELSAGKRFERPYAFLQER